MAQPKRRSPRLQGKKHNSEERFRLLAESAPNGILLVGADGRIEMINPAVERLFGYQSSELVGQPIESLVPHRYRTAHPHKRGEYQNNPEARPMGAGRDLFALRKDGTEFPVEIGLQPIHEPTGQMILATVIDITERRRVEVKLRQSEGRFRLLVESAPDGIVMVNRQGMIDLINPAVERLFGYQSSELVGQPIEKLIPQRYHKTHGWYRAVYQNYPKARPMGVGRELFALRKDSTEFPVEIGLQPFQTAEGHFICVTIVDITERRRTEAKLRQSEERFATAFYSSPQALVINRLEDGRYVDVNDRFLRLIGWERDEVIGRTANELRLVVRPKEANDEIRNNVQRDGHLHDEVQLQRKSGELRYVEFSIEKILLNNTPHALTTIVDITEQRQTQEALYTLNQELERRVQERTAELSSVNKELESFSYSVSHDLRTPLRHIQGYIAMLLRDAKGELDEKKLRYLKEISDASREMSELIDDLLAFSRMSRTEMRLDTIKPNDLISKTVQTLEPLAAGRHIEWKIEALPEVRGDPALLKVVFMNLLQNALKYSAQRDPIQIEIGCCGEEHERKIFYVKDNGVGFDMKYVAKLFGVFQRLHRSDQFEGTGIGLATVQRIINRHGGRTWAQGAVDQGATFYFTLAGAKEDTLGKP